MNPKQYQTTFIPPTKVLVINSSLGGEGGLKFFFLFIEEIECYYPHKNIILNYMGRSHGPEKGFILVTPTTKPPLPNQTDFKIEGLVNIIS